MVEPVQRDGHPGRADRGPGGARSAPDDQGHQAAADAAQVPVSGV